MSKQIDERVVSMQFDNRHFESNVQTSISTLDKLKRALHLDGVTKGLDNVSAAAKNVNISPLGSAVETVSAKFSALQVMGVTALANITNSAVNTGKRLAAAFTITPVKTGFNEYELKMGSIQTIMASTGETLETVNKHLDELNKYSDQTIYSFQDMTSNIGKFTNAGVKLEDAVLAIKGISNEAAVSGANANEASRAMYNFAQALSSGYVKLIDWKSIELANMATVEFKEQLIATAVEVGTLKKTTDGYVTSKGTAITATKNFNDSLKDEWMTSEVLISTLKDYADETTDIGKKASKAATEVKTFSQLMDTLKESVQSGWAKTWEIIIGDYNEAKNLFTMISNVVGGFLDKISNARNKLLGGIMSYNPLSALTEKIDKSGIGKIKETTKALTDLTDKVKYYRDIVNRVWRGDYKSAPVRYDLLRKDGYNAKVVQSLVNLGYDKRNKLTEDDIAKAYKKAGVSMEEVTEKTISLDEALGKLNDEELKNLGFNAEEIKTLRDLQEEAKRLNVPIEELLKKMEKSDGRTLLLDSFKNIGSGLIGVFKALGEAWSDIFPAPSVARIYTLIDAFNKFTEKLRLTDAETGDLNENGDKLKRTFEGVFALIDIVTTIIGGPVKLALKIIGQLLGAFDLNILDLTAGIGDAIVAFRDWLDSIFDFTGVFKKIAPHIQKAIDAVKKWFDAFKPFEKIASVFKVAIDAVKDWFEEIKLFDKVRETFKKAGDAIKDFADTVKNSDIVKNILSGLGNGLKDGAKTVWEWMKNLGKKILDGIKKVLGIHSPSTEFFEIGKNIIAGLIDGIKAGFSAIGATMKELAGKIVNAFSGLDMSKLSSLFMNIVKIFPQLKILNVFSGLAGIFSSLGENVSSGLVGGLGKSASAVWDAIKKIASGLIDSFKNVLGIHSPSKVFLALGGFIIAGLVGGLLGGMPSVKDALNTVGQGLINFFNGFDITKLAAIGSIIGVFLAIKKALNIADKFANAAEGFGKLGKSLAGFVDNINKGFVGKFQKSKWTIISEAILKVAIAIGILVASLVVLSKVDKDRLWPAFGALAAIMGLVAALAGVMAAIDFFTKGIDGKSSLDKVGSMIVKIAGAMLLMVYVAKIAGAMDPEQLKQGMKAITQFSIIIGALMVVGGLLNSSKYTAKIGSMITKIAGAILVMVLVAKMAGGLDKAALEQGMVAIGTFALMIAALMAFARIIQGNTNIGDVGSMILKVAAAILVMVYVAKIAGSIDETLLERGTVAIAAFGGILVGLMWATKLINGSKNIESMGSMLLKAAASIAIMVLTAKLAASMSQDEVNRGAGVIIAFGGLLVGLMWATKIINGSKNIGSMGGMLLKAAASIAIMVLTAKLAASMSQDEINRGSAVIIAFGGLIIGLMWATKLINGSKNMANMGKTLLGVAAVIAAMAISVALLSLLDPAKMAGATVALGVLMAVFALVLKCASGINKGVGVLIVLTTAVAVLGTVLIILSHQPWQQSLAAAGALSAVLLAMTVAFTTIAKAASTVQKGIGVIVALTVAVAAVGAILILLAQQPWQQSLAAAGALSALLLVLTGVAVILGKVQIDAGKLIVGVLGLVALCIPLFALVGALACMSGVQNAMANAQALSLLMGALTILLYPLMGVGALMSTGIGGAAMILGLGALLSIIVLLYAVVGALAIMGTIKDAAANALALGRLMETLTAVLVVLALVGPLAMIGVNAMWSLTGLMVVIGALAVGIGALMEHFPVLKDFLDTGIPIMIQLAGGIGKMIGAFVGGIASEIAASLPSIGKSLSDFMNNAADFINGARGIDDSVSSGVSALVKAILSLTATDLITTLTSWLTGGDPLANLGTMFKQIGEAVVTFSSTVSGKVDLAAVKVASEAGLALVQMVNAIPNSGGIVGFFAGENDMDTFAAQIVTFGDAIAKFSAAVSGKINEDAVTAAANAGKTMIAMAETIPNSGGVVGFFAGENDMSMFGAQLVIFGDAITKFSSTVAGKIDETAVTAAANAGKVMIEMANTIPNSGGVVAWFTGDNDLASFGAKLILFGQHMVAFSGIVAGNIDAKAVTAATNAGKVIAELANTLPNSGGIKSWWSGDNDLGKFGGKLVTFGEKMKAYSEKVSGIDSAAIGAASTQFKKLIDMAKSAAGTDFDGLGSFGKALGKLGKAGIDNFINAFKDAYDDALKAGETMITKAKEGAEAKQSALTKAIKSVVSAAADAISEKVSSFESAGKDLGSGLVDGIDAKQTAVYWAGYRLGQKAVEGEKDGQESNSPSKLTMLAGKWLGEGLVIGINKMDNLVYKSGYGLGQTATDTISSAISRISDVVNSDIDTQPTIRPVLDLSDVRNGASTINGMFSGRTLSVDARTAGLVSASMAGRQNGDGTSDVVSAIKALRKDISNMPRDSVSIGGITYSGDSEINDAVHTLVRAARLEGRM